MNENKSTPVLWQRLSLAGLVIGLLVCAWTQAFDSPASEYAQSALKRAAVSYAVARSLNGVISVAQETEIALQPAGVGVTFMPGELLDPVNDLVERCAWVLLASTASLGVQRILLEMSSWWGLAVLVSIAALAALAVLLAPQRFSSVQRRWVLRFALIGAFVRFAVPILLITTSAVSSEFLQPEQEAATVALQESSKEIDSLNRSDLPAEPADQDAGFISRLQDFVGERLPQADVQGRIEETRERLAIATRHIIDLIVTFTMETILVPLFVMWVLSRTVRGLLRL